jgi:DNA-binding SARP family transcriptional activator/Tfp pilus assembly protein PilF
VAPEVEFCLLGPLLVRQGGMVVAVPSGKQRALLAALLLNANRVVPLEELVDALWGPGPPVSARKTAQNYVKRLRRSLGVNGRSLISTQLGGYLIRLDPRDLDVARFESLLGAARLAARDGSWDRAADRAHAALSLWRGEPLADVPSERLALREIPRLAEMRLQAIEARIDADLHLGRHADVIADLRQLASIHPLRERLHALLMLALYRNGQRAGALAAYQDARRLLIDELGTEPVAELRELHQLILLGDPAPAVPEHGRLAPSSPEPVVPRQLPAQVRYFVGRARELKALTKLLSHSGGQSPAPVVISAIGGAAGVGKTALAVHWAHQVAERFPDGQLYVNLRGYDPGEPMPAPDALTGFLGALGVAGQDIPVEVDERAARYRSLLAGRRMLVVLDNAADVEHVRPLLPGSPACAVVVTSRDSLAGLVARDGARRLDLDLLPLTDAVGLLRALIGGRVDADPSAAAALAYQCSRLPLALRVAAELVAARAAAPLADLAGELADQQRCLNLLDAGGDQRTAVRAVFSWSCRHLDAYTARAFRLLGLHPGPDLDPYGAAALTNATVERAAHMLDVLARAHLIRTAGPGRYGMHDLLRAYARELAAKQDGEEERRAALTRLFDRYLHTAAAAMDTLFPAERHRRPGVPSQSTPAPPVADPDAAWAWLDTERAGLVAACAHTAAHGWTAYATRLAAILFRYLDTGGHYLDAVTLYTHALNAAHCSGDRAAEATALTNLGLVDLRQGRCQQATDHLQQALAMHGETGDRTGEARTLTNLGNLYFQQGRYRQATDHYRQALAMHGETGDRTGEARTLTNLGAVDARQGRYRQAISHHQRSLALFRETGDRVGEARVLENLGNLDFRQGRYQQATGHLQLALALAREASDRIGEAHAVVSLGLVDLRQGRYQQALDRNWQALALTRQTGDRVAEAEALNGLGEILLATGRPSDARIQHAAALDLASQISDRHEQARAHNGLAYCHHAHGDLGLARRHWQQAHALYTDLGAPEAGQVRRQLTSAGEGSQPLHARSP